MVPERPSAPSSKPETPRGTFNEARWDEVLSVAAGLFSEKGYRAATLQDIASRLGMLKGSLYYYIESKEALLFEILKRAHLKGLEFLQEVENERTGPPAERLERLIRRWMHGVEVFPADLVISVADLRYLQGPRRAEIVAMRSRIGRIVEEIIADGISDGSFDPAIDPYTAMATLFQILNNTSAWYRPGLSVGWPEITDWYVRLILGGLRPAPGAASGPRRRGQTQT